MLHGYLSIAMKQARAGSMMDRAQYIILIYRLLGSLHSIARRLLNLVSWAAALQHIELDTDHKYINIELDRRTSMLDLSAE
eukprot:SAG31_NODE_1175_length_9536_cov_20.263113_2_plen_81_part_00